MKCLKNRIIKFICLLSLVLFLLNPKANSFNPQLHDYTLDEEDDYYTAKEHFNIYYQELKLREINPDKGIWASELSDLGVYNKNKELEDIYLKSFDSKKEDKYDSSISELMKIRNKYNTRTNYDLGAEVDLYDEEYTQNRIGKSRSAETATQEEIDFELRKMEMKRNVDPSLNVNGRTGMRLPQGHPGMNMDSVITHKQFSNHKENKFNNFNYNNNNNYSYFQMINFSIFGFTLSEYLFAIMIVLFSYFYLFSKTFNDKYATAWYDANRNYLDRFSRICVKPEDENIKNNTPLMKDTYNVYRYYVEEYKSIKSMTSILEFKVRQDTSSLISGLFFAISDKIYYRITINPVDPVPNIIVLCKKSETESIRRSYKDVEFFTNEYQPSNFEDYLVELSENEFTCDMFRNKELLHYFKRVEKNIDLIYYTDQKTFCDDQFGLYFVFSIPLNSISQEQSRKYLEITHFVCLFCEELSQIRFTEDQRIDSKAKRIKFERMKLDEHERKRLEQLDLEEEIKKEKERAKAKFSKSSKKKN